MKQYYIYLTTNLVNNKKYIGKHYGELDDNYIGSGTILKSAIQKYGKQNFKKEILSISKTEEENAKKEKHYIDLYKAVENKNFYNIADGGQGGNVTKGFSKEEREKINKKISESNSGKKHHMYGKHHTEETKEKISNSVKKYWTEDKRQEWSLKYQGQKNPMYGKHHTEETKEKIRQIDRGYMQTKEYKEKMSNATKGEKNGNYGNRGEKAKNGKQIIMYDEEYNIIKIFNTKQLALEFLGLKGHNGLNKAIREKTKYKNFYWEQK